MIPSNFIDFYGDQTRWFVGTVMNVKDDPLQIGRVRVKVHGMYDDIKEEDLPWAQIILPVTHGVTSFKKKTKVVGPVIDFGKEKEETLPVGQYLGMLVGTQVFGIFLDGPNSQLPLVVGTIPKEGDGNKKAEENYPYNKVYQTESGHYKEWDDTEGEERVREQHTSGTYYEMKEDGSRDTVVQNNDKLRVKGDVTIIGEKDANIRISGNCNITVTGDARINAKNVSVTGTDTVTVRAGNKVVLG
jgi:hypothetical protein